jgi:hypothetical protein
MKVSPNDYVPLKLGLLYFPPAIVVKYGAPTTQKQFTHQLKVKTLNAPIEEIAHELVKNHAVFFSDGKITLANIIRTAITSTYTEVEGQKWICFGGEGK